MMLKETLTGFADEISPDLNATKIRMYEILSDIHYIEMRGVDGRNLCDYSLGRGAYRKDEALRTWLCAVCCRLSDWKR